MKVVKIEKGTAVIVVTTEEATHIGHRLNVSSTTTFSQYRHDKKTGELPRHPLAENFLEALTEAGLWGKKCKGGC